MYTYLIRYIPGTWLVPGISYRYSYCHVSWNRFFLIFFSNFSNITITPKPRTYHISHITYHTCHLTIRKNVAGKIILSPFVITHLISRLIREKLSCLFFFSLLVTILAILRLGQEQPLLLLAAKPSTPQRQHSLSHTTAALLLPSAWRGGCPDATDKTRNTHTGQQSALPSTLPPQRIVVVVPPP